MGLITKLFGTRSQRELKKIQPMVDAILALESQYKQMPEEELKGKTAEFRARLEKGETLDDLLPEAFAAIREAADRVIGLRPYPVQLIGGIVLHQGRIAEMKTGEGKTLVAILPAYLICCIDGIPLMGALFESSSAVATVGLSLGYTAGLSAASRLILIFLMYFGRVGGLTVIYAVTVRGTGKVSQFPQERLTVG